MRENKMISYRQIKAARALLGWTQGYLARAAGLHLNAVNKIENAIGEPRLSTIEAIQAACETAGIHFRGQRGVEMKEDVFETRRFEGTDYIQKLVDDGLSVLRNTTDEILTCTPDEAYFNQADQKQNARYYRQMKKVGFRERIITRRSYNLFLSGDQKNYRWLPEQALGKITYCVYIDRTAFINWALQQALIVRNKALAETFRVQFEFLWSQALPFD